MQFGCVPFLLLAFFFVLPATGNTKPTQPPITVEGSLESILKVPISNRERAKVLNTIATFLWPMDVLESVHFRRLAWEFSKDSPDHFRAQLYIDLINAYISVGNSSEAINIGKEAIEEFKESPPKCWTWTYLGLLKSYIQIRDFDQAIHYGQICVEVARKYDPKQVPISLSLLGETYIHIMESERGIALLTESSETMSQWDSADINYQMIASNQIYSAQGYLDINQLDSCKHKLLQTDEMRPVIDDQPVELVLWLMWGHYYEEIGDYQMAVSCVDSCQLLAIQQKNISYQLASWNSLSSLYSKMNNLPQALIYTNRQLEFKDSIAADREQNAVEIINLNHELQVKTIEGKLQHDRLMAEMVAKEEKYEKKQLYFVLSLVMTFGIIMYLISYIRHRKSKLIASELTLANVQIKSELEKKSANLANNILRIASLNSFMVKLHKELEKNKEGLGQGQLRKFNQLIHGIKSRSDDKIWQEFEIRFEQAHQGFYKHLVKDFSDLSPNERRLCAFMKLNMTSKEISRITGQTPHSINVARGRLRKKLGIVNEDISLVEFIGRY